MEYNYIYHFCFEEKWTHVQERGNYHGSEKGQREGVIYMSFDHQIKRRAARYKGLYLLKMHYEDFKNNIRLGETGRHSPHFYDSLNVSNVSTHSPYCGRVSSLPSAR